ncbi:hypothetical protein RUM44_013978 [Polyplax serrata]|uniref:Uncharacterized protein n=1 Tax=Polyplax serrata TaxID=468196 RepID=A0ABR1BFM1_POLSC
MDKEQDIHIKGLSKKVAPFTKGEITSFGFKKKSPSQLPVPLTLGSNGSNAPDKTTENRKSFQKNTSDDYQSGSSIESLCHAPYRSTPKMIRKRDLINGQQQQMSNGSGRKESKLTGSNSSKHGGHGSSPSVTFQHVNGHSGEICCENNAELRVNRFGFRQVTPPRTIQISRSAFITGQGPQNTRTCTTSVRSKSEGPKEAFLKQSMQSSNSMQSGLNQSKSSLTSLTYPKKFTLQTSQLPRPQFAVRMSDAKTVKTAANYYRRGGNRQVSKTTREASINEDSGFESHPSANNTLEKKIEILDSSPGSKVRLPAYKGKKLEMKIVGNKFELMKKGEETPETDIVTEISVIKIPVANSSLRTSTAVIHTGLVEQRTNQYLKRISQPYSSNKNEFDTEYKVKEKEKSEGIVCHWGQGDEGLGAESEEEKLFKDSRRSEKYLMSEGYCEADDMLPGEAMAEDDSFCLSLCEDIGPTNNNSKSERKILQDKVDVTPNTIRLDALKLSKELKYKNNFKFDNAPTREISSPFDLNKNDETFPEDSILEQLSSDSDSLGDKGEDKNNDKEKNLKMSMVNLDTEDLGIEIGEDSNSSSKDNDTDVEDNELDLNENDGDVKVEQNFYLGSGSPVSPSTPTHISNSLSISEGRDFLIDDEIADQPQLCFSEKYVERSCQDDGQAQKATANDLATCREPETDVRKRNNNARNKEKAAKERCDVLQVVNESTVDTVKKDGKRRRINSGGTLSPCDSFASDDLMLDFETNSLEETAGRFEVLNECTSAKVESNTIDGYDPLMNVSSQKYSTRTECKAVEKSRDGSSGRSTPVPTKCPDVVPSPHRSMAVNELEDATIKLDMASYQHMFQDVVGMKSMLLKLKRLLSESEGGLHENGRSHPDDMMPNNVVEEELTNLRRQVLFLQQQLEEREKTVQVLRLRIDNSRLDEENSVCEADKTQCNAATQTGLDQFQQDFPHLRMFQKTQVV